MQEQTGEKWGDDPMKSRYKIVYYERYCNQCAHEKKKEEEDPCRECLNTPANEDSHRPVKFKKK